MSLLQFLVTQIFMFFLFLFSASLTGGGQGWLGNFMMNLITFMTASWVLARAWGRILDRPTVWALVFATTLSFNVVTYLLGYAVHIPLPKTATILQDFGLVLALSAAGILLGLKTARPQQPS